MVEVHPAVLVAFGAVAAGFTAFAIFRNQPSAVKGKTPSQQTSTTSKETSKKKKTKAKKEPSPVAIQNKKEATIASIQPIVSLPEKEENDDDSDEDLPIPVPMSKSKSNGRKDVANNNRSKATASTATQPTGPTAAEKAAAEKAKEAAKRLEEEQQKAAVAAALAEKERLQREEAAAAKAAAAKAAADAAEEEKKKKAKESAPSKPKETPQQREARLERQRIAKAAKKQEEPVSNNDTAVVGLIIPADTDAPVSSTTAADKPEVWAVVEDKRKTKTKKSESDATSSSTAAPTPATPATSTSTIVTPSTSTTVATPTNTATATTTVVVQEVPSEPVDFVKSMVPVEAKKLGAVIGAKGVNLKAIQEATGAEIQAPKGERDATATTVMVTVSGTADAVAKATRAIKDMVTKGYSKLIAGEDFQESSISVHPMYLAEIIGKGGCNIRAIQDATSVKLNIPQVARDHALPVKVTLAGSKDKVAQVKEIVTELMTYYRSSVTHPLAVHVEMDIPSVYYNYIIGARGSEIKHIQGNFKVSVHIPNADTINKNVVIVGESAGVKNAEKYIQKIIDGVVKDKEEAERLQDSWVDPSCDDSPQEEWMDQYTHPSRRSQHTSSNGNGNGSLSPPRSNENVEHDANVGAGGGPGTPLTLKTGEKSNAAAANAAAAWGASVLASAEGW